MTVPMEYAHASERFDAFMQPLRERLGYTTSHQTYQTVEAVLRVFRRRLTAAETLLFADALPAVLRAIFVAAWRPGESLRSFASRETLTREVQDYRADHNLSPDSAIADMAAVLWQVADRAALEAALSKLPDGAAAFWATVPD